MKQLTLGFCCLFSDPVDELNVSHGKLLQPLSCPSLITSYMYTLSKNFKIQAMIVAPLNVMSHNVWNAAFKLTFPFRA